MEAPTDADAWRKSWIRKLSNPAFFYDKFESYTTHQSNQALTATQKVAVFVSTGSQSRRLAGKKWADPFDDIS
ncbi:MAG: hypothetical protein HQM00_07405 [Magnetococcales bacterium]|nr:hypothetical protein [Magnetococcales bacterium]